MLQIAMIDDEKESLEMAKGAFEAVLKAHEVSCDIKTFTSADIFLSTMQDSSYDLICSDIMMKPMDGITLAKKIRSIDEKVPLIFISSNESNVFSCFNYNPIGFIRKTNFFSDTSSTLKHYVNEVLPNMSKVYKLTIKSHGEQFVINIKDIIYIEGNHNYNKVVLNNENEPFELRKPIMELEKELEPFGFIRTHKGYLVNYIYISKFVGNDVVLKNKVTLPISRTNRDEIIKKYMNLANELAF